MLHLLNVMVPVCFVTFSCIMCTKNCRNDFGVAVADEYCALFNFLGIRLDVAIREFLSRFCLIGETQERARILEHFAKRYHQCNPTLFHSAGLLYLNFRDFGTFCYFL